MTAFPGAPQVLKGGFVVMNADGTKVERVVPFQYNPDGMTRALAPRGASTELGDRLEGLRLVGMPVETLKLDAELDATDRLEKPLAHRDAVENGLAGDLAALETLVAPRLEQVARAQLLAAAGTLEILPLPSPLVLLVFGRNRLLPVRITEFSVIEEAFDQRLNPIRARISLGMRVLSTDYMSWGSK
ncbi:MAG: hypothetical protein ACK6BG_02605 [Cyanobacteriota bacterium]